MSTKTKPSKLSERHARGIHVGSCVPMKFHNRGLMHLVKWDVGDYYGSLSCLALRKLSIQTQKKARQ